MILKKRQNTFAEGRARRLSKGEPLDVRLTVKFKFGDQPGDSVTVMEDRSVPMVESVFKSRDRIVKGFVTLLLKTGLAQPRVARELFPLAKLLRRSPR
jgi:hypothetical protein